MTGRKTLGNGTIILALLLMIVPIVGCGEDEEEKGYTPYDPKDYGYDEPVYDPSGYGPDGYDQYG